ncbi:sucrose synthase 2-like [Asparagus officinalis]|uniref:sucrose synthase 2-like n=1 Tax=Asparagus officinalis TaxID=4686 RepID=UPI00098DEF43|nr:sucrose synthase 2-like [Asparagus officinalis]
MGKGCRVPAGLWCSAFTCWFIKQGKGMLQPHQLLAEYKDVIPEADHENLKDGVFEDVLKAAQAIVLPLWVALAIRPRPGVWEYVRVNVSELAVQELTVAEYLQFKEELAERWVAQGNFVLELDFEPFNASFPRLSLSKSIRNGVQFLNRYLSSKLFNDKESMWPLLNFLRVHSYRGTGSKSGNPPDVVKMFHETRKKANETLDTEDQDKYDEIIQVKQANPLLSDIEIVEKI